VLLAPARASCFAQRETGTGLSFLYRVTRRSRVRLQVRPESFLLRPV